VKGANILPQQSNRLPSPIDRQKLQEIHAAGQVCELIGQFDLLLASNTISFPFSNGSSVGIDQLKLNLLVGSEGEGDL
jgi:hypothetical protein